MSMACVVGLFVDVVDVTVKWGKFLRSMAGRVWGALTYQARVMFPLSKPGLGRYTYRAPSWNVHMYVPTPYSWVK